MASTNFIRFFDKLGNDMNFGPTYSVLTSLYDGATSSVESFTGKIFFPRVSIGLIESQQLFLLQEVTGPVSNYELRKVKGTAVVVAGNPTVTGVDSDFSVLEVGENVKIGSDTYAVTSVGGTASFDVFPIPSSSISTQDIYYYDYLSYSELRSSPGTFQETLNAYFVDSAGDVSSQREFFLYSVNYAQDSPVIERFYDSNYQIADGSSDSVDPLTGRILLSSGVTTLPTQINLGFSSGATVMYDDIYESKIKIVSEKTYQETLVAAPVLSSGNFIFTIGGTSHELYTNTDFYFQGVTAIGATETFFNQKLKVVSVGVSGSNTLVEVEDFDTPSITSLSNYRILWKNFETLALIDLYGETEAEDERFKLVLENFGKKIDFEYEYIFRDSDIHEDLPDYHLLNKKRKELLLEGDSIYPYMGSYRALINIINFFGYYDLRIKEYFLNVDSLSPNYGKYMHVLVPKNEEQRNQVREAWRIVPSKIYKKTSLFGLFYDLNRATDQEDIYGIPDVEDAFDFSPEEVLIKLFGLKELLKKYYLPLNARIYDITGEGIYFERIRIDSWSDNLNHLVLNLGVKPQFKILPESNSYLSDIRRMDHFYIEKFVEQGLTGFIGATALDPYITAASGSTGPIQNLYPTYVESYEFFLEDPYNTVVDETWNYMPPGIYNPNFNNIASRLTPLPDDIGIVSGAPALLEAFFDISWEESNFTWGQLGILGPSGAPININHWTWESLGRGEFIEMEWVVEKNGVNGFYYESGRRSIGDFLVLQEGSDNYAVQAVLSLGMSGDSVGSVSITNAGFGYTTVPNVSVSVPGGTGVQATISVSINADGYVNGATVTNPGSGYNFVPFVTIDAPDPVNDVAYRYLHAVALPYTGTYDVSLYLYDITNGFSVDFQKYEVKSWNVDFVSIARRETPERTWQDFAVPLPPDPNNLLGGPHLVTWEETTGPWYYPLHVLSQWQDAQTSWESLNFSSYDGNSLFEYNLSTNVQTIDRISEYVVLTGNLTGNLNNLNTLNVGDYLFFYRESSDPIVSNLQVPTDNFGGKLQGLVGLVQSDAILSGSIGSTAVSTAPYDTTTFLSSGDQIWLQGSWYTVDSLNSTTIYLTSSLSSTVTSVNSLVYPVNGQVTATCSSLISEMARFSRVLSTEITDFELLNPGTDFYGYLDGLTFSGSSIVLKGDESTMKQMILKNSSLGASDNLYLSWGLFSGTYAIEITNISLTGSNTQFRLNDVNKELYYLDGNFSVRLADYDVDYAENRIGPGSLTYQSADEITWDENPAMTWFGLEYHGGVLCGYVIPFVGPGGVITVDENPSFAFSGNFLINSTKSGLILAAQELNDSLNPGIQKYSYAVLPEDELYITDFLGGNIDVASNVAPGATQIPLNAVPDGGALKIPAQISVTISGGSVTSVTVDNPGWGYTYIPNIVVSAPGGTGTLAVLSANLSGLPYQGQVSSITIVNGGSGYASVPTVTIDAPTDYKPFDNYVWTGYEWLEVSSLNSNVLELAATVTFPISAGDYMLLPYQYHKQLFANPSTFQQFYYFIHGKAKNPSTEMLSYINFANGVESEWAAHPDRTYTYPLRNSFYFLSVPGYSNLDQDYLYNKWVYEGSDYPPLNVYVDYSSNVLSYESRIPFAQTLQSAYSYIDTAISSLQQRFPQFTPVVFSYDKCRIPGKQNPMWTISNENTGEIEVMSQEAKLMWNFTKTGNYTVSLSVEDANGNISTGKKNSFIVI